MADKRSPAQGGPPIQAPLPPAPKHPTAPQPGTSTAKPVNPPEETGKLRPAPLPEGSARHARGQADGADDTVNALERIVQGRGRAPDFIRCDNGPEFVAHALKDWCRVSEIKTGYIEPGAPWQNPYAESFNGRSPPGVESMGRVALCSLPKR